MEIVRCVGRYICAAGWVVIIKCCDGSEGFEALGGGGGAGCYGVETGPGGVLVVRFLRIGGDSVHRSCLQRHLIKIMT